MPADQQAIKAKFDSILGQGKRFSTTVMSGDVNVQMPVPLQDLDWHGLSNLSESRICAIFGVPPTIAALRVGLENAPYSKIDSAIQIFYRDTMVPIWRDIADFLTKVLIDDEFGTDTSLSFRFDLKKVRQLQEDRDEESIRLRGEWNDGLVTRNEARELLGYAKIKGGDVFRVPMAVMELPARLLADGVNTQGPQDAGAEAEPEDTDWEGKPINDQDNNANPKPKPAKEVDTEAEEG
jgi:hypothetical protein